MNKRLLEALIDTKQHVFTSSCHPDGKLETYPPVMTRVSASDGVQVQHQEGTEASDFGPGCLVFVSFPDP